GVIGSKNKNKVLREKLIEDGFSEELLNKVHAPIGFNIGAETVEEITISIIAELIYNRSKMEKRSKLDYC
ncbi:MAG: XdhC family protein, partial [Lachnospiraceae bacterium]|nr:XdhC family protein [Lachnospiraceae bacterium]